MIFSAFTSYGFLEYSSKPSVHEQIYKSMKTALGGDTAVPLTYDFSLGTHVEASLFARSKAIASGFCITTRAENQFDPSEALEMIPVLERDRRMQVSPSATINERRAALVARSKAGQGARRESIENQLMAILGDNFIAYHPSTSAESLLWPASPGDGPGVYTSSNFAPRQFRILLGNSLVNSPDWVNYVGIGSGTPPGSALQVGDLVCMNAGDLENAERVVVTGVRTSFLGVLQFQALFTKFHGYDFIATTGPFPAQFSTHRFSFIIVSDTASVDPILRSKVDEVMGRIARSVSEWAIVQMSSPTTIGPFVIDTSPIGAVNTGTITI